jgi:putative ABC transport system permease protein
MIGDYLGFALKNLGQRGVRSWLTMLGIFVGIAAVVALISLGQGLQNYINSEFEKVGVNRIIVTPGGGGNLLFSVGGLSSAKLTERDLDVVKSVRGIDSGIGVYRKTMYVEHRGELKEANVFGSDFSRESLDYMKTIDYMIVDEGRYLNPSDRNKAIIGRVLAEEHFDRRIGRGDRITIDGSVFEVVGINKKTGNPGHDVKVVIPLDVLRDMQGADDEISVITASVREGFDLAEVAEDVRRRLRRSRDVREGEEDFTVQTAQNILDTFNSVVGVVQAALSGIAAISLLVGGLGIMTTMYTSVLERTKQIGIMKSVGAKNKDILLIFLIEAGFLGLLGGVIGVVLGLGISFATAYVAEAYYGIELLKASADLVLIFGAMSFSFLVGCFSGLLPAYQASKMKPVDAMRYG